MGNYKAFSFFNNRALFILALSLFCVNHDSVAQEIRASLDTNQIKIGEQINYKIEVVADSSAQIKFTEGQSFLPLEVVETSLDTLTAKEKLKFIKNYIITSFDAGEYILPGQTVSVNNYNFYTDSLAVKVLDVEVDTTKQKLFPVKESIYYEPPLSFNYWVLVGILVLVLILLVLGIYLRKKKSSQKAKLPPFEQALFRLKELDQQDLLAQGEEKRFYTVLTEALKGYVDQEIDARALESTTSEFIALLKAKQKQGKLLLENELIDEFELFLKRADLVKFAGFKQGKLAAQEDRKRTEKYIQNLKNAIPAPTLEELQQDEAYLAAQRKKQKKRQIIYAGLIVLGVAIASGVAFTAFKGSDFVRDLLVYDSNKELLNQEWISSKYGYPEVKIITPKVLTRRLENQINKADVPQGGSVEEFYYGTMSAPYHIVVRTMVYPEKTQFNLDQSIAAIQQDLEKIGAKNILVKDEDFTTIDGIKGKKVFGSFSYSLEKKEQTIRKSYQILNFGYQGAFQQIILIYPDQDSYAQEITSRIVNSVELNTAKK
ncbi:DUF4381 domain-containing protein [Mesonia sp. HuA40]|uniref:DUF4381 domain-containing protein n=1 Tax=Mesonia sp. HuA40 TaxID=2602761 RepID=UPI0011C70FE3|nr:DUF4381 domain-containing protein [Mesonia sp. HuA40]TXK72518.1 DUF4381 domain-containing protein [Mesonia sp. HuA40]